MTKVESKTARYRVAGMDCASCGVKIEKAARGVRGVSSATVSMASQMLTVEAGSPEQSLPDVEKAVQALGYRLSPFEGAASARPSDGDDDDDLPKDLSQIGRGYRRALWLVVVLNVGYGVVEIVGGFLAKSQALKADALDFFGDGLITFFGLLATTWGLAWRARAALIQGVFLGALGVGVVGTTVYRAFVVNQPEAGLMGVFGAIALVVNVVAALILIPHRTGDGNVRAVWLFSRNDAIGNVAVVAAAGLVSWTGTRWPDLVVAIVVASLFLHSSWSIIKHARVDLRSAAATDDRQEREPR